GVVEADPRLAGWTPQEQPAVPAGRGDASPRRQARPRDEDDYDSDDDSDELDEDEDLEDEVAPRQAYASPSARPPLERAREAMDGYRSGGINLIELQSQFARATDELKRHDRGQSAVLAAVVTELS